MTQPARSLLLAVLVVLPSAALAVENPKAARAHYESGMKHYNLGHYRQARKDFEDAYLAKPDAAFLFNIGQCHRMLGEPEEAASSYRAYLRANSEAPNRSDVEKLIEESTREVERRTAEKAKSMPPQEVSAPAAEPPPPVAGLRPVETTHRADGGTGGPVYRKWWLWTAVGGAAVAAVVVTLVIVLRPSDPTIPVTPGGHHDVSFSLTRF
jgi:tetratricopeptide (TPR) repeat protein